MCAQFSRHDRAIHQSDISILFGAGYTIPTMRGIIRLLVIVVLAIVILNLLTFGTGAETFGGVVTVLIILIAIAFVVRGGRL